MLYVFPSHHCNYSSIRRGSWGRTALGQLNLLRDVGFMWLDDIDPESEIVRYPLWSQDWKCSLPHMQPYRSHKATFLYTKNSSFRHNLTSGMFPRIGMVVKAILTGSLHHLIHSFVFVVNNCCDSINWYFLCWCLFCFIGVTVFAVLWLSKSR